MNYVRELPLGKRKRPHIARQQVDGSMPRQMRRLLPKPSGLRVSTVADAPRAELVVSPKERLQQPATEEARATGDEDPLAPQFLPQPLRMGEHVVQILG